VPFSVEVVPPEWALVKIGLMIPPTVGIFEQMGAQFPLLCFKTRWIYFFVHFAAPPKFAMIL